MKAGDIVEEGACQRAIVTSVYRAGVFGTEPIAVLTPIPEGMTEHDLGRRFFAAGIRTLYRDANEHFMVWPESNPERT